MKKNLLLAGVVCLLAAFTACDDEVATKYEVTVTVTADGTDISELTGYNLSVATEAGSTVTAESTDGYTSIYRLEAGNYTVTGYAENDEFAFNGSQVITVAEDTKVSLVLTPSNKQESGIIFKEVYTYGVQSWYFKDAFYELVNNSDETKYLDGIILACIDRGYNATQSAWADSTGAIPTDFYPLSGYVMQFPGDGTEYPLEAGESVLIAAQAYDHSAREITDNDMESPSGDLSTADWELNIPTQETNYENPDVPSLNVIAGTGGIMFMPAVFGQPLVLAKLPEGVSTEEFVTDSTNYHSYAGSSSATLCIPVDCVLDAIDIQRWNEKNIVKCFLTKDDAGYTMASGSDDFDGNLENWVNPMYTGKSIRRKCTYVTSTGRAYFQDTNNSTNDFIMGGQTAQPRRTFTEAD